MRSCSRRCQRPPTTRRASSTGSLASTASGGGASPHPAHMAGARSPPSPDAVVLAEDVREAGSVATLPLIDVSPLLGPHARGAASLDVGRSIDAACRETG